MSPIYVQRFDGHTCTMSKYLVISLVISICSAHLLKQRILGGSDSPSGEYPYMISLRYEGEHVCGGSIIDKSWVLTAAHCVNGLEPSSFSILTGTNKLSTGGIIYNVLELKVHENYDSTLIKYDIALLKVDPITYTNMIKSIQLDSTTVGGDVSCTLSGWGFTSNQVIGNTLPDNLQHINLKTIKVTQCQDYQLSVDTTQLCTFTKEGEGFCTHDSGGPLVRTTGIVIKQIGIVSWMMACARGYPDVYTRISAHYSWIKHSCSCI